MTEKPVEDVPEKYDILKIKAEELAAQLTLRDLPVFKSITADELTSGAWSQRNKNEVAPNIAEFTFRFNVICLWSQKEILSASKTSKRAQLIEYFIKVAKKLLLLNNIHGAFALTSALLCHSIFRLTKSWAKVGWHEKSIFEKLKKLFSADNNWENLRRLTDSRKLPCIPHIGIYLTDLMFIQNAMKQKHIPLALGERGIHQNNMDSLIRTLASFQDSTYDELIINPTLQEFLSTINIDRDQIRIEEDKLYNLSLFQEPQETSATPRNSSLNRFNWKLTRSSTPKMDSPSTSKKEFTIDPQLKTKSLTPNLSLLKPKGSLKFKKGHKKTLSHGDERSLGIDNSAFNATTSTSEDANATADSLDNFLDQSWMDSSLTNHHIHEVIEDNALVNSSYSAGLPETGADSPDCLCNGFESFRLERNTPRSLSVFGPRKEPRLRVISNLSPFGRKGSLNNDAETEQILSNGNAKADIDGILYRSTVRSSKSKPVLLRYSQRIWAELHQNILFEFERKTIVFHMTHERELFRTKARRMINLKDSSWKVIRSFASSDSFELHNSETGAIIVYRCSNSYMASIWSNKLMKATGDEDSSDALISL